MDWVSVPWVYYSVSVVFCVVVCVDDVIYFGDCFGGVYSVSFVGVGYVGCRWCVAFGGVVHVVPLYLRCVPLVNSEWWGTCVDWFYVCFSVASFVCVVVMGLYHFL